jgi:hypothetical protein
MKATLPFDPAQLQIVIDELTRALDIANSVSNNLSGSSADRMMFELRKTIALVALAIQNVQRRSNS